MEPAGPVLDPLDAGVARRSVDVDVEDGKEDPDAHGRAAKKPRLLELFDVPDDAVGRGDEHARLLRDLARGIAKEQDEETGERDDGSEDEEPPGGIERGERHDDGGGGERPEQRAENLSLAPRHEVGTIETLELVGVRLLGGWRRGGRRTRGGTRLRGHDLRSYPSPRRPQPRGNIARGPARTTERGRTIRRQGG